MGKRGDVTLSRWIGRLGGEKKLAVPLAVQQCIHWENIAGRLIRSFRPEKANKKVTNFCIFGRGANGGGQRRRCWNIQMWKEEPIA
jgi:hypothetical protein